MILITIRPEIVPASLVACIEKRSYEHQNYHAYEYDAIRIKYFTERRAPASYLSLRIVEVRRHGDYCMGDLLTQIGLGGFLHLAQHHSGDLLGCKDLHSLISLDLDVRLVVLLNNGEREEFDIVLHGGVHPFAADQSFRVEHGVLRIRRELVLSGIANQPLAVSGKRHVGRRDSVTLIVGYDLHTAILVNADTERQNTKRRDNLFVHKDCESNSVSENVDHRDNAYSPGVCCTQINSYHRTNVLLFLILLRNRGGCKQPHYQ
ncbi:hypothetical protein X777_06221 [Ooceraea biroi]|uniref:Uncharacterized protein n=1 Tax=Ooceraea biroi TaxID=2015173 RepID=A0A026WB35_OOCBI|nr:hypothetical protein X777_06221 [Ooceraea biroi]